MESDHIKAFISSQKLADVYKAYGYLDRAKKVSACGQSYVEWACHECGECWTVAEFRCDDRLCYLCARSRVARLLGSYGGALKAVKNAKMVTVSMRSRPIGELKDAVKELWDAFSRLRHRDIWKTVLGAIVSLEITFNTKEQTWHPHLHILVDSEFIVWKRLRDAWVECTNGEGSAVYIQKCIGGWERELVKYITKVSDLVENEQALREFLDFARGRRFLRTYGSLYNCAIELEHASGLMTCRGCGAQMHVEKYGVNIRDAYRNILNYPGFMLRGKIDYPCKSP